VTKESQVINLFKNTTDNSVKSISKKVGVHHKKVSRIINAYLETLKPKVT